MKTYECVQVRRGSPRSQKGVGMVEVLVALVLLALGVLGYAAMQIRAVESTGAALTRSNAMVLLRGLAEEIRVMSPTDQANYTAAVHSYAAITASTAVPKNCFSVVCTASEMATFDAYRTALTALQSSVHVDMYACPLTAAVGGATPVAATTVSRQCLVAAWGTTTPTSGPTAATDCMTETGVYHPKASCVMLEAY